MKTVDFFSKENIVEFINTSNEKCFSSDIEEKPFLKHKLNQLSDAELNIKESFNIMELVSQDVKNRLSKKYAYVIQISLVANEILAELGLSEVIPKVKFDLYTNAKKELLLKVLLINCGVNNKSDLVSLVSGILRRYLLNDNKHKVMIKKSKNVNLSSILKGGDYETTKDKRGNVLAELW